MASQKYLIGFFWKHNAGPEEELQEWKITVDETMRLGEAHILNSKIWDSGSSCPLHNFYFTQ